MKEQQISDLFPEYLEKTLSEEQVLAVEKYLASSADARKELEEFKILFKAITNEPEQVPSDKLRLKFEEVLELEKASTPKVISLTKEHKKSSWATNMLKVAASIALLVGSFQMGSIFQQKKSDNDLAMVQNESLQLKQTAMLSLMENQSASKRIQGVSYIEEFPNPDEAIVKALTTRLLYDENDNVRLNAFEALSGFTSTDTVKTAFINALETEKNPSIQIALIQALVKIQEKKAIGPMQRLLERDDTQPFIKNEIKLGLPKII